MKTIQIKTGYGEAIFEHTCDNNTVFLTVLEALISNADLAGADLAGADLAGANLSNTDLTDAHLTGANLSRSDLEGADLAGADLSNTDLTDAYMTGAYLSGANLKGANLSGAYLSGSNLSRSNLRGATIIDGETLHGSRPIIQIGPIGSRHDYLTVYLTNKGQRFDIGCQRQITREIFEAKITLNHGDNKHAQEYRAALALIDACADIWAPKEEAGP